MSREADRRRIAELEARVEALEAETASLAPTIPDGTWKRARIADVERRKSRTGRWFWQITFDRIEGYPRNRIWANPAERVPTDLERWAREVGVELVADDDRMPWVEGHPQDMTGTEVNILIGVSNYAGRTHNVVREVKRRG